jgi:hypothetical protein
MFLDKENRLLQANLNFKEAEKASWDLVKPRGKYCFFLSKRRESSQIIAYGICLPFCFLNYY